MSLVRIGSVQPLPGFRLRLGLSDGRTVERDVGDLLAGPVFEQIRSNRGSFEQVRAESGTVVWPNGADLCPDVLIWEVCPRSSSHGRRVRQESQSSHFRRAGTRRDEGATSGRHPAVPGHGRHRPATG